MKPLFGGLLCSSLLLVRTALGQAAGAGEFAPGKAEPAITYGALPGFPLPKTIIFSVGPDEIIADAPDWRQHGVSAFFLDFVARAWSSDVWATDGEPWTIGASDKTFQKTKQATGVARTLGSEVFLKVAFDHPFEWFNDTAWLQIEHNFRQFAIFARDSGCQGIALDIEYIGQQYSYAWSGYDYRGYTRADLLKKVQARLAGVARVLYQEFPDMVLLTFPECGLSLGTAIQVAWIEEAARRQAPGGVHYCTESTYRNPNVRYMLGHAALCNELFHRLLSPRAWKYWQERCSIAAGVWPLGFDYQDTHNPGMTLEEFRQGLAGSLMVSRRYNWIYSHNSREQLLGRKLDVYTNGVDILPYLKVMADRQVITVPKYISLATAIRTLRLKDYSTELGVAPWMSLIGPADTPSVRLVPLPYRNARGQEAAWRLGLEYLHGGESHFREHFGTLTDWLLVGPFASDDRLSAQFALLPPELSSDPHAEYDGMNGKVRWQEYHQQSANASVDLTQVFKPTERVCAYALCYVSSPVEQEAQVRFGSNDAGKVWLGGRLVLDYPREGTAELDRDIVPVRLLKGTTPILLKITNNLRNWGFVFRLTDPQGRPLPNLKFSLSAGMF
jgi:hypothetical protein